MTVMFESKVRYVGGDMNYFRATPNLALQFRAFGRIIHLCRQHGLVIGAKGRNAIKLVVKR